MEVERAHGTYFLDFSSYFRDACHGTDGHRDQGGRDGQNRHDDGRKNQNAPKTTQGTYCDSVSHQLTQTYVRHKKYLVHDEHSELKIGERIRAQACRPLSARKRFTLLERLGFKDMPTQHDEHGSVMDELRRRKADAAMPAEQRERLRIEKRVKDEMSART